MRTLTSMSRFQFEEWRKQIVDGSLEKKWRILEGQENSLTKSQQVELRQISAIAAIYRESPDTITHITRTDWREICFMVRGEQLLVKIVK